MARPFLDISASMDGYAIWLMTGAGDEQVQVFSNLSDTARARIAAHAALDRLDAIFRVEGLHAQRREA